MKKSRWFLALAGALVIGGAAIGAGFGAKEALKDDPIVVDAASTLLCGGSFVGSFPNSETWTSSVTAAFYSGNGFKFSTNNQTLKSPAIAAGNKSVDIKIQAGYNGSTGSTLTIGVYDSADVLLDSEVFTPDQSYTAQETYNNYTLTSSGNDINYAKIAFAKNPSNLGMKFFSVSTHDTSPVVNLDFSAVNLPAGGYTSTVSVSTTANLTAPLTYAWSVVSGTSAAIPDSSTNSSVVVTSAAIAGDTVIRCTVTDSASLTASADCTVSVSLAKTVDELIAGWADSADVYVKGYVVSEDLTTGTSYQFHLASETQSAYSASSTGTTCVDLFNYSSLVAIGDYVIIHGTTTTYGSTREIGNGYTVVKTEHTPALLNSFIMGSSTDAQCGNKFAAAKAHFLAMSTEDQNTFKGTTYADAKARYEAWALNQGQKPYEAGASSAFNIFDGEKGNNTLTIVLFSVLGVLAVGGAAYFLLRKKKHA